MTHSIHIRPETDIIRAGNRVVMGALNQIDGVVFLTKQQKKDVQHRFGNRSNYFVIPHSIKLTSESLPIKERTSAVVILSRLHQEKRLEDAITAFKEVVIREPKATLHIYGDGPERKKTATVN
ncbi:glycosyltransferase [Brochothrix campestris]|uniref:glycosyltransferase n=1 Tax=Brochothrix campestris TaxID=2757 RepID=UPI0005576AC1|nr:glycosyltransferase [Brochothrix campestris]